MVHLKGNGPHQIAAWKGQFDKLKEWVHCCMLYLACEMRPFLTLFRFKLNIRGPPDVLHFKKINEMEDILYVGVDQDKSKRFL